MVLVAGNNDNCVDRETIEFYRDFAREYVDHQEQEHGRSSLQRERFVRLLPPGAEILDLGCGAGFDAMSFELAGFSVTAIDASPELVAIARQRVKGTVRVGFFHAFDSVDVFDGIWAAASLVHVPRDMLPNVINVLSKSLGKNGYLYASFRLGDGECRDSHRRYYSRFAVKELVDLFGLAGLNVLEATNRKSVV